MDRLYFLHTEKQDEDSSKEGAVYLKREMRFDQNKTISKKSGELPN
jgi:hypothetical protein